MKEVEHKIKEPSAFVKKAEVKKQEKSIGTIKAIKGLDLFQMDMRTGKIEKVQYEEVQITFKGGRRRKLKFDSNMMYVQALNMKNAKRKFTKRAKQLISQSNG